MLHKDEVKVDESLVRQLISDQFPQWAGVELKRVQSAGTSNVLYRIGGKLIARFPRTRAAAEQIEKELAWLPRLAEHLPLRIPTPVAQGLPGQGFPFLWSVYEWLKGKAYPESSEIAQAEFARDLATFVGCLQNIDTSGGPAPGSHNFYRGAPLRSRDEQTREAIESLSSQIDAGAATEVWEAAVRAPKATETTWIHGDLLPGNLLFDRGRLSGVIDFGGLGVGDPACDLMPAWNFFSAYARQTFRDNLDVSESTWVRGRGWALSQALIFVPYYLGKRPRGVSHALRVIQEVISEYKNDA